MPTRIQRERTKGWRMPEGVIYVGRPGLFGNPFRLNAGPLSGTIDGVPIDCPDISTAIGRFRGYAERYLGSKVAVLRGKDLACWCALDKPCHADVLLEIANRAQS